MLLDWPYFRVVARAYLKYWGFMRVLGGASHPGFAAGILFLRATPGDGIGDVLFIGSRFSYLHAHSLGVFAHYSPQFRFAIVEFPNARIGINLDRWRGDAASCHGKARFFMALKLL